MTSHRRQRRMMSDINVVPYIDVMLVLLIIFMITAPLITQGVKIDLPQAPAEVIQPSKQEPIVVSINAGGEVFIDVGESPEQPVAAEEMITRLKAILKLKPDTEVLIKGDREVNYGRVIALMADLNNAGVEGVGLITEPPEL